MNTKPTPKLNNRVCECAACHRFFATTSAFDKHRRFVDDGQTRTCIDPATIKGLTQRDNGAWGGPRMPAERLAQLQGRVA